MRSVKNIFYVSARVFAKAGFIVPIILFAVLFFIAKKRDIPEDAIMHNPDSYDTICGKKVTKENIFDCVKKAPPDLANKVIRLFKGTPGVYKILVRQDGFLTDVGQLFFAGLLFLKHVFKMPNIGNRNYVFKLPGEDFLIKICGPNNRFITTTIEKGLGIKSLYVRKMEESGSKGARHIFPYVDFDGDKERIKKYFNVCCEQDFLHQTPSAKQAKEILRMVAGAMPQSIIRGIVKDELLDKYVKIDSRIKNKTVEEIFDEFLDYAFEIVSTRCFNKSDLANETFVDTYNIANRLFHYSRFAEAIDTFTLDQLEKPPVSYMLQVNPKDPCCCADKNVVLVQAMLKGYKPLGYYLKHKTELNEIFTQKAVTQLLQALKYAGLWDINGENVLVNPYNKKITYVDFEYKTDTRMNEIFNRSEEKRKENLCYMVCHFLDRFGPRSKQRNAIIAFIHKNEDIDLKRYIKDRKKNGKRKSMPAPESLLGKLLYFDDLNSENCLELRKAVYAKLQKSA